MTEAPHFPAEGGCACGTVRYRLEAAPLFVHCCHCSWCQRESGSAFAVNALIETSRITPVAGAPTRTVLPSASGKGQTLLRCPDCGTSVWSHYNGMGEAIAFVRVGTLDHASVAPPDIHIYTSTRLPWVILPDDVPAMAEYYRRSERWPADSLTRFKTLRDAQR